MKIKKISALILAATLTCSAPAFVYAEDSTSEAVDQAVEILSERGVEDMLSDPDNVVDIIVAVKDAVGSTDVSDDTLNSAMDTAASELGLTLDDSDKETLIKLYKQFKDMDLDEEQLRSKVNAVYDKLEELGITKEDVKGILGKIIDIVKSLLN